MNHTDTMHLLIDTAQSLEAAASKETTRSESRERLFSRATACRKAKSFFEVLNPENKTLTELQSDLRKQGQDMIMERIREALGGGPMFKEEDPTIVAISKMQEQIFQLKHELYLAKNEEACE